ncbi:MAG: DUF362 domain-containing protein [Anaerolineae bacterium]|nr:DUF362 domain-containing protein [Anaerolineae bacterium]MDW8067384.1 DUF362 domain-containing protein [Anaerolineae bacterium]
MGVVSVVACKTYDPGAVRGALEAVLAPIGGMGRFVQPGMRVLVKPNLLAPLPPERAVTTHPTVVRAVAEMVQEAGGEVWIGDSPAGPVGNPESLWRRTGMTEVAAATGARLVPFDGVEWRRLRGQDYFIARPVFAADLVITLPKLKTHTLTLYTGAVKNLFGAIPGTRKREVHYRAPAVPEFSQALADVLDLVRPGLAIMDGVIGQEGNGPGAGGTPRVYGCLAASADPVALDTVLSRAMGCRPGEVLHLREAAARGLGVGDPEAIEVLGDQRVLNFGPVRLPVIQRLLRMPLPGWLTTPLRRVARLRPRLTAPADCVGCGHCAGACPRGAVILNRTPRFRLDRCVGCMCCAEVCPQGVIAPYRGRLARLLGLE